MRRLLLASFLVATVTSLVWSQEPIRERIEWADIWVTDADKNDLPRVLLIGDSITRGYCDGVEKQLAGKAYCARLTTSKCVADSAFLDEVQLLLKQYRFAVIHFNNGLHGFGYTEDQYCSGLAGLLEILEKYARDAKLIWATTTPVREPTDLRQIAELTERVKARNQIAAELLRDRRIVTNDLYGLVDQHQEYCAGDGVHFNEQGRELQAKQVAEAVLSCLPVAQDLPTAKPEDVGVSSEKVTELSKFMQSLVDDGKIAGGVTMMARHGKVIHLKAVGMADREEKRPMTTDAIFRIASMTKPVTSVAVMMLYEQGKLGLDDPVSKYIPEFANPKVLVSIDPLVTRRAKGEITIRHLLTHTSGLGYPFSEKIGPIYDQNGIHGGICTVETSLEELMKRLATMPLLFDPGEQWNYSMSTDVLGRVVEVASGMSLDRFIEARICRPLGMKDTFCKVPADKLPRLVSAYLLVDNALRKVRPGETLTHRLWGGPVKVSSDYVYDESNIYVSGGGSLCSTPNDFVRFCQMLLNGGRLNEVRLLREETVRLMTTNQLGDVPGLYGFGFGITLESEDVHQQLRGMYNGGGYWTTTFAVSPKGDWALVTMSQLGYDEKLTPACSTEYEKMAAEAIEQ